MRYPRDHSTDGIIPSVAGTLGLSDGQLHKPLFRPIGSSDHGEIISPRAVRWNPAFCHNFPMCGRYRLSRRKQLVEEYFDSVSDEPDWEARYNIAPTQPVQVIRQNPTQAFRELSLMRRSEERRVGKE